MRRIRLLAVSLIVPGAALAADGDFLSASWALGIAMTAVGSLISAYVAGLQTRITKIEADLSKRIDGHAHDIGVLYSKAHDIDSDLKVHYPNIPHMDASISAAVKLFAAQSEIARLRVYHRTQRQLNRIEQAMQSIDRRKMPPLPENDEDMVEVVTP